MTKGATRTGKHVVSQLRAHVVLLPKHRHPAITQRVAVLVRDSFENVCMEFDSALDKMAYDYDHVHLLLSYPAKLSLSKLINSLKLVSARRLAAERVPELERAQLYDGFWAAGYCAVSCGERPLELVRKYVENQRTDPTTPRASPDSVDELVVKLLTPKAE